MTAGPWIGLRRKWRIKARRRYRGKNMEWINGRLCFSDTKEPVPNVKFVPKPKQPNLGLEPFTE